MRTKLMAFAAVAGVLLASGASAEGLHHCKRPLITRVASVTLAKQPTLVQSRACPQEAALRLAGVPIMKKQLAIAVGVLFTLGTAVSASLNDAAQPTEPLMTVDSVATAIGLETECTDRCAVEHTRNFVWLSSAGASALS